MNVVYGYETFKSTYETGAIVMLASLLLFIFPLPWGNQAYNEGMNFGPQSVISSLCGAAHSRLGLSYSMYARRTCS